MRLLEKLRRKEVPGYLQEPPIPREHADTFVMLGDILWGDCITIDKHIDEYRTAIHGWTLPRPVVGDIIVCKGASGKWGQNVLYEVSYCADPKDMWFGRMCGVIGYVDEPTSKRATQYIDTGGFVW